MAQVADRELAVGRATREAYEELLLRMDEARAVMAAVLGTDSELVALTHSTTEGVNLALGTIDWRAGDRAVTTSLEHPGVTGPLALLRDRLGVEVVEAQIGDGGDDEVTLAALRAAVAGGRTRAVAVSHVAWSTGAVLPAQAITGLAREAGAASILDGAQSAGAIALAVDELGADFYAISGQKWLLGPEGTGALASGAAIVDRRPPAGRRVLRRLRAVQRRERRAVAGRPALRDGGLHKPSIVGSPAARLAQHVRRPPVGPRAGRAPGARATADRLAAMPASRSSRRGRGWRRSSRSGSPVGSADEVAEALARRVFAIVRSIPGLDAVRLSVALFTTDDELRRVLDGSRRSRPTRPRRCPAGRDRVPRAGGGVSAGRLRRRRPRERRPTGRMPPGPRTRLVRGSLARSSAGRRRRSCGRSSAASSWPGCLASSSSPTTWRSTQGWTWPAATSASWPASCSSPAVAILGSWLTYLVVPQPGRPGVGAGGAPHSACSRRSRSRTLPSCSCSRS